MPPLAEPVRDAAYFVTRESCPVCGSHDGALLYAAPYGRDPVRGFVDSHYRHQGHVDWRYLEGTDFVLSSCGACDSIWQKHAPNDVLMDNIYNVMIDPAGLYRVAMNYLTVDSFESVAGELALLFRLVNKHPTEVRFLDYGLGYGRWARVALALGARVFATEISPKKIAHARAMGIGIVTDADLARERFDLIHTEQVFEHLPAPRETFRMLAGALADKGVFKVAIPPAGAIRRRLARDGMIAASPLEHLWHPDARTRAAAKHRDYICVAPLEHLNVFSAKGMRLLAAENGLNLISATRREAVPLSFVNRRVALKSLIHLAKVTLRPVFRRDSGYYVFRR